MKELYLNAEMDVVEFSVEDVIATSLGGAESSSSQNANCPNEGPTGGNFL